MDSNPSPFKIHRKKTVYDGNNAIVRKVDYDNVASYAKSMPHLHKKIYNGKNQLTGYVEYKNETCKSDSPQTKLYMKQSMLDIINVYPPETRKRFLSNSLTMKEK